jgi:hypothetical protein
MVSSMIYGPFSLSDATYALLRSGLWLQCELFYDFFAVFASVDGTHFYGSGYTGSTGNWVDLFFNLTDVYTLGDVTGEPNVWIMFLFQSDSSITYKGAFVDNVQILKATGNSNISNDTWSPRQWALNNVGQTGGTPGADIKADMAWAVSMGDP